MTPNYLRGATDAAVKLGFAPALIGAGAGALIGGGAGYLQGQDGKGIMNRAAIGALLGGTVGMGHYALKGAPPSTNVASNTSRTSTSPVATPKTDIPPSVVSTPKKYTLGFNPSKIDAAILQQAHGKPLTQALLDRLDVSTAGRNITPEELATVADAGAAVVDPSQFMYAVTLDTHLQPASNIERWSAHHRQALEEALAGGRAPNVTVRKLPLAEIDKLKLELS